MSQVTSLTIVIRDDAELALISDLCAMMRGRSLAELTQQEVYLRPKAPPQPGEPR